MIKNAEEFIEKAAEKVYPFAYCLSLDELMASQLVIDGISRFVLEHVQAPKKENDLEVFRELYSLAKHRNQHLKYPESEKDAFSSLTLFNRATLYLCEKAKWSAEDVSYICSEDVAKVKLALHLGRGLLKQEQQRAV